MRNTYCIQASCHSSYVVLTSAEKNNTALVRNGNVAGQCFKLLSHRAVVREGSPCNIEEQFGLDGFKPFCPSLACFCSIDLKAHEICVEHSCYQ